MRDNVKLGLKNTEVFSNEFKRCFDLDSDSKLLRLVGTQRNEMTISLTIGEGHQELWGIEMQNSGTGITVDERINDEMIIHPDEGETIKESLPSLGYTEQNLDVQSFILTGKRDQERKCYYLPASRSGIIQSHRVMASSLMDRAIRSNNSELPTLSAVIVDFMKQLPIYEENRESNNEMSEIANILESEVLAGKIIAQPCPVGTQSFFITHKRWERQCV